MKYFTIILLALGLVALLLGACVPVTARPAATEAATDAATGNVTSAPDADWQTYTDAEVGYSITTPP